MIGGPTIRDVSHRDISLCCYPWLVVLSSGDGFSDIHVWISHASEHVKGAITFTLRVGFFVIAITL